jgi:FKBP-type peptidyl-prolyl cis-trans isomerase FklB
MFKRPLPHLFRGIIMKRFCLSSLLALIVATPLVAQDTASPKTTPPTSQKDQASYTIGLRMAESLKAQGLADEVNPLMVARGIIDMLTGAKTALNEAQQMAALQQLEKTMQSQQQAKGEQYKKEGEAFLAANAKKPGVKVLPSGLQYKVIKPGTGASPKATDSVSVHYHGTFTDGKVFDSSVDRGEPAEFPVNRVIPGWTEALQLMKTGGKWQLVIPSDLAYGPQGNRGIPPHAVLLFEVELLGIK